MDIATIVGAITGVGLLLLAMITGAGLLTFIDMPSLLIVVGGTSGAMLISYPLADVIAVLGVAKNAILVKAKSPVEIIQKVVELATIARREGILGLEELVGKLDDEFMRKGLQLAIDGTDPEIMREILEKELSAMGDRHSLGQGIFISGATLAPAFGMIGTLIGLIGMLKTMEDPSTIGPMMAVALITTFYGAVIANLICLPLQFKLKYRAEEEQALRNIMLEGMLSIQQGDNPRIIEEKLKVYLAPKIRVKIGSENKVE